MAIIAEFTVLAEEFPLGRVFEGLPEAAIELERIVPTTGRLLPYFWIRNHDAKSVEGLVESYPGIESIALVDRVEDGALFRADWDAETEGILTAIIESDVVLLQANGTREKWVFEIRAEKLEQLSRFQRYCREHDIDVTLTHLHSLSGTQTSGEYDLTPAQREALVLAFEEGYYDHPRETNLEELASELGITRPSLSSRLNRGYRNLIRSTLIDRVDMNNQART